MVPEHVSGREEKGGGGSKVGRGEAKDETKMEAVPSGNHHG